MGKLTKLVLIMIATFTTGIAIAQDAATDVNEKDGFMRSNGKIYVVVAIVLTILAGLILYVARLDRKITRLEKGDHS